MTDRAGEPQIGATVKVKDAIQGTITDIDGKYSITVPSANSVLQFSYIGFINQEIAVGEQSEINVQLLEDVQLLDEVKVQKALSL